MFPARLLTCAAALHAVASVATPTSAHARPITLDDALAAVEQNPDIAVAAAEVEVADAQREQADTATYNPYLSIAAGPAFGPDGTAYDLDVSIGQAIELGGKRSKRTRVAVATRAAAAATLDATRATLRAEVWRAFHAALVADERVRVATENEATSIELATAAAERLALGDATQTEVNVANAGRGRATAARKAAERDVVLSRAALAAAIGAPDDALEPVGRLPVFPVGPEDDDATVAAALAARHELDVLDAVRAARDAETALADVQARPDPEIFASWSRSAVEDVDAILIGVRFELPVRNRNTGGRRAARASHRAAVVELDGARRAVELEVRTALHRYRAALDAVASFDRDVIASLDDNLRLAREALAAGKLDLLELNAVRRDLVDSQLSYLDTLDEAVEARAALERALGASLEITP